MVHHQKNLLILFISLSLFVLSKQNLNLSSDVPSQDRSNENKCTPQQIHLSLGDQYYTVSRFTDLWLATENYEENQATLIWTAQLKCKFSVRLASLDNPNDQNITEVKQFDHYFYDFSHDEGVENPGKYDITAFIFTIENVKYDHNYEYVIINNADTTQVTGPFKFRLAAPKMELAPQKMLFVGDLSVSERGNKTIARLNSEMTENAGSYAGLVYLGDVAYNIHDDNGKKGDEFFNAIQNITSKIPLIVTPGNRDKHDHWDFLNFRIRNPMYSRTQNQYFSFNWQGIHFVSINFDYYNQANQDIQEEMYTWIEQDLTTANDGLHRVVWPFIVVFSHQPIYCMYSDSTSTEDKRCCSYFSQMKAWDALFHRYGVDLMISAHLHSYERMGPINKNESVPFTEHGDDPTHRAIINPTGTVFIIEGAGGNDQYLPSEYKASGYGYVVDRNPGFGALYATIDNGEYKLRYEHHDSETGNVVDTMNIIKTPEAAANNNTLQDVFFILAVGLACLGLTFGYIKYNRWRQSKLQEAEDSIPLNKEELRSSKLRYNRPGQRGISMVDM